MASFKWAMRLFLESLDALRFSIHSLSTLCCTSRYLASSEVIFSPTKLKDQLLVTSISTAFCRLPCYNASVVSCKHHLHVYKGSAIIFTLDGVIAIVLFHFINKINCCLAFLIQSIFIQWKIINMFIT
jgi:hypothetical protein